MSESSKLLPSSDGNVSDFDNEVDESSTDDEIVCKHKKLRRAKSAFKRKQSEPVSLTSKNEVDIQLQGVSKKILC